MRQITALTALLVTLLNPALRTAQADADAPIESAPVESPIAGPEFLVTAPEPLDPEAAELVAWARGRFATAGLEAPAVPVLVHDTDEPCGGYPAVFYGWDGGGEINVCLGGDHSPTVVRRVLLHELSHAWEHENLDETDRQAFMDLRELDSWADAPWYLRGSEHLAEVMAWGLMEDVLPVYTVLPNAPDDLHEAFVALTGVEPING
jgi:hypothetical protein